MFNNQPKIDTIVVNLFSDYHETCFELNKLYFTFDSIKSVMNFGSDDFFLGNDSEQIVKYANALELF